MQFPPCNKRSECLTHICKLIEAYEWKESMARTPNTHTH